jgi:hypothetical protein
MRLLAIALLLLSGLALAAEPPPRAGTDYALDGLRLGDTFAQAAAKAPWSSPCDQDPVADKARRAVIYGTKRCPKAPFPGNTNAVLFLAFRADPKEAAPIEAMAWLGGNYFDSRSDFPVALGTKLPDGKAASPRRSRTPPAPT